jgi:hypothetical protein
MARDVHGLSPRRPLRLLSARVAVASRSITVFKSPPASLRRYHGGGCADAPEPCEADFGRHRAGGRKRAVHPDPVARHGLPGRTPGASGAPVLVGVSNTTQALNIVGAKDDHWQACDPRLTGAWPSLRRCLMCTGKSKSAGFFVELLPPISPGVLPEKGRNAGLKVALGFFGSTSRIIVAGLAPGRRE